MSHIIAILCKYNYTKYKILDIIMRLIVHKL